MKKLLLLLLVAGCSTTSPVPTPAVGPPAAYDEQVAGPAISAEWWKTFDSAELQALVDEALAKWGRIAIAVANAAANPSYGPLTAIPDEAFDKILANNVKSDLWLAVMTLPQMGSGGSFIVVGSIGGILANTVIGAYGISKAADHHLVRNLAAEGGPKNVRVNAIAPGYIVYGEGQLFFASAAGKAMLGRIPQRRLGQPEDLDGALLLLASDAGRFITGTTIVVDGGLLA